MLKLVQSAYVVKVDHKEGKEEIDLTDRKEAFASSGILTAFLVEYCLSMLATGWTATMLVMLLLWFAKGLAHCGRSIQQVLLQSFCLHWQERLLLKGPALRAGFCIAFT